MAPTAACLCYLSLSETTHPSIHIHQPAKPKRTYYPAASMAEQAAQHLSHQAGEAAGHAQQRKDDVAHAAAGAGHAHAHQAGGVAQQAGAQAQHAGAQVQHVAQGAAEAAKSAATGTGGQSM